MTGWLLEALIGSALLMLLVLVIRRPVARLWGAHFAYALWALPLIRMMMPAIPGWTPLYRPVAGTTAQGDTAVAIVPAGDAALYTQPLPAGTLQLGPDISLVPDWPTALLLLWALGGAAFVALHWLRHSRFVGRAAATGTCIAAVGNVEVIVSPHVSGPMAAGIVRRRILLPVDFLARYSPQERRLALEHEAAHHDRGDLAANLAGLLLLAAHWWNPIAHAAWRAFRADQELACDATVLAGTDAETRAAYGQTVLKSARVATPVAACAINHKSQLKDRIAMMKDRKFTTLRLLIGGLAVTGVAAAALAATASGQSLVPPAPPAPPQAPAVTAAPPAPPAAPAPPMVRKAMLFKHKDAGKDGKHQSVRVIVKDGVATTGKDGLDAAALEKELEAELAGAVEETRTEDGRRIVMVRKRGAGGSGPEAEAALAQVKAGMRADCTRQGISLPADADVGQLALCGRDIQKEVREALATARKAINDAKWLSTEERARALKGLEQAQADIRREVVVKLEK